MKVVGFGLCDDLVCQTAKFFRFGEGGDDPFVVDEGCHHVAEHGPSMG